MGVQSNVAKIGPSWSEAEQQVRTDLACAYRLVAHYGWGDLVWNHISARLPGEPRRFLLNPLGWRHDEITASSLVTIDLDGQVLAPTGGRINYTGFVIHGAIHRVRHDAVCVLHTHTDAGMAVSALEEGVMPFVQDGFQLGKLAYHDYEGVSLDTDECDRLAADLGDAKMMILRNHGLLTCGGSVAEAFVNMYYLEKACRVQLQVLQTGRPWRLPAQAVLDKVATQSEFPPGHYEWPALLRLMDKVDASYRD